MAEEEEGVRLVERLERLERLRAQLDDLNKALKNHLDRLRRRRNGAKAKLASFRHQAKKLADRAPS